jgi:hypothetical protein
MGPGLQPRKQNMVEDMKFCARTLIMGRTNEKHAKPLLSTRAIVEAPQRPTKRQALRWDYHSHPHHEDPSHLGTIVKFSACIVCIVNSYPSHLQRLPEGY